MVTLLSSSFNNLRNVNAKKLVTLLFLFVSIVEKYENNIILKAKLEI